MLLGQISVVLRTNGASFNFFDIAAITDPFRAQWRQALFNVAIETRLAPGTAGVINADRLVHFDLAAHRLGRREGYFAERPAKIDMYLLGHVNLARIWKVLSDRLY